MKTRFLFLLLCLPLLNLSGSAWAAPLFDTVISETSKPVIEFKLPNQLNVILKPTEANSIVSMAILIEPGALFDPEEKMGQSYLMTRVLTKGTESRTSSEITDDLQDLGAKFGASSGYDLIKLSMQSVEDDWTKALDIVGDVMKNPTFPIKEIETEKQRIYSEIRMSEDRAPSAAMKRLRKELFAPSRYALPLEGTNETVAALTQRDLVETWQSRLRPEMMTIAIVGNLSREEVEKELTRVFGDLIPKKNVRQSVGQVHRPKGGLVQIERDVEQAFVAIGVSTCDVSDDDNPAVDVATTLLGGGMSSRLFVELRDKRGLAYSVGATNGSNRGVGFMATYIGTSPDKVCESLSGLWNETTRLREQPVTIEELDRAKNYLLGGYLRGHETNYSQAFYLAQYSALGLGTQYDSAYAEQVRAVTTRDIMRVANKYFIDPATVIVHPDFTKVECLEDPRALFTNGS